MTLIVALNIKREKYTEIYLCGDSRVTQTSEMSGKYISHSDMAQKVILIAPNIYVGIAGDYNGFNKVLGKLHERLLTQQGAKKTTQEIQAIFNEEIQAVFDSELKNGRSETSKEIDLLVAIRDLTKEENKLFKMTAPKYIWYELDEGIHCIGSSADIRSKYKCAYDYLNKEYKPNEIMEFNDRLEANVELLLRTYIVIFNSEINGLVSSICFHNTGTRPFRTEMSPDGGKTYIVDEQSSINHWKRTIKEKKVLETTTDFKKIWGDLNKL